MNSINSFASRRVRERSCWMGQEHSVRDGFAVVIPAGTRHNVLNTSSSRELKLYGVYSPPEHKEGTVHVTKKEADADHDHHFDGRTSLAGKSS